MSIIKLSLKDKYQPQIYGLGEIYEQISVEKRRQDFIKKFGSGDLFLASNKTHSGLGLSLEELVKKVKSLGYQVLDQGFVDSPPWQSKKIPKAKKFLKNPFVIFLAKIIFYFLVYFEPFLENKKRSHMVYVLGRKKEK